MKISSEVESKIIQNLSLWRDVSSSSIHIEQLAGGLNNFVYKVSINDEPFIYKELRFDETVNVAKETSIIRDLSVLGLSHRLFYMDQAESFRIEEYVEGCLIESHEMIDWRILVKCIEAVARLHQVDLSFAQTIFTYTDECLIGNQLSISRRVCAEKEKHFEPTDLPLVECIEALLGENEVAWLKSVDESLKSHKFVFSHNDVTVGNILLETKTSKVRLLDWETAFPSYRANDLVTLFTERFIEYDENAPDGFIITVPAEIDWKEINKMLEIYLLISQALETNQQIPDHHFLLSEEKRAELIRMAFDSETHIEKEIAMLIEEFKFCSVLNHHNITAWGISVVDQKSTEIDYLNYAKMHRELYLRLKSDFYPESQCPN